MKKYLIIIIFTGLLVISSGIRNSFAADTWYVGEGLKEGDYFRYNLCEVDLNSCSQFEMDFWVKGKTEHGDWEYLVKVIDGSKVIGGTMQVGRVAPEPLVVSKALDPYAAAYKSSIVWLSGFATRIDPKDLAAPAWGRIGSIGGMEVGPRGIQEKITVQGGTFDTYLIGWHKSTDNKIWVVDNFPFPVKALIYVDVTSGTIPVQYQLELLEYGNTASPPDFLEGIETTAPEDTCPKDTSVKQGNDSLDTHGMVVSYGYTPEKPRTGCDMIWTIEFQKKFDINQFESDVHYDIFVLDKDGNILQSLSNDLGTDHLYAPVGKEYRTMHVKEPPGTSNYVIHVYGIGPDGSPPDTTKSGTLRIPVTIAQGPGQGTSSDGNPPVTKPNPPMKVSVNIPMGSSNADNDLFFDPSEIVVTPGSTITWTNNDSASHTVTSGNPTAGPDGKFDSSLFGPGKTFQTVLDEKGTYSYFCQVHPWMTGSITVDPSGVPEFPISVMVILILMVTTMIVLTRFKSIAIPKF